MRTALFAWLFARRHVAASSSCALKTPTKSAPMPGSVEMILDAFDWLGMDIDEGPREGGAYGPYVQSEQAGTVSDLGKVAGRKMAHAYKCFATAEELAEMRKAGRRLRSPVSRHPHRVNPMSLRRAGCPMSSASKCL